MQHRILRTTLFAVGSLMLVGCDVHDNGPNLTRNVNTTIQLNAAAANNGVTEMLDGFTFTGFSGAVLAAAADRATGLAGQTVSIEFDDIDDEEGEFILRTGTVTAEGDVLFASCRFTVTSSTNPTVIPVGTVILIQNCSATIVGFGVVLGSTDGTLGQIVLNLNGSSSAPLTTLIFLRDDGVLIVRNGDGDDILTLVVIPPHGSGGG